MKHTHCHSLSVVTSILRKNVCNDRRSDVSIIRANRSD
jgi:hypothetical protein